MDIFFSVPLTMWKALSINLPPASTKSLQFHSYRASDCDERAWTTTCNKSCQCYNWTERTVPLHYTICHYTRIRYFTTYQHKAGRTLQCFPICTKRNGENSCRKGNQWLPGAQDATLILVSDQPRRLSTIIHRSIVSMGCTIQSHENWEETSNCDWRK